jgi:C4-dicarboxylate transporter
MKKRFIILITTFIGIFVSLFIYAAATLTRLLDSDILDVSEDDEEYF